MLTKKNHLTTFFLGFIFSFLLAPSFVQGQTEQKQQEDTYRQLETFANILSILQDNYVEEIDTNEAIEGAITGLLLSLDPHSSYLKPESYQEFQNETVGSFTGIGIEITLQDDIITVIAPIADTPAAKAGIKAQDQIIKIDGISTKNKTPLDAVKLLRGPKGSEVTISIYRKGFSELKDITLIRDTIPLHSVKSLVLKPGFGYIRITNFQSNTTKEFKEHLANITEDGELRGLIVDLRNNPGGLLNQAVSIADLFLDKGLIVFTRGRNEDQNLTYEAHRNNFQIDVPIVVLVNEGSASASEIVAGAIQDQQRGIIVGSKTFGKGSVQTIIPLPDGAGLRMTTARYFTPNGRSIQATGIVPDVEVTLNDYEASEDDTSPQRSYFREEDLENHMENGSGEQTESPSEISDDVQELLRSDNQLNTAFNILKSLVLYSAYNDQENPEKTP